MRTYLAAYRVKTLLGMVGKGFEVVFELMVPVVVARMIDEGVAGHNASVVVRYGILLAALSVLGYCFTLFCQKMAALVSQGVGTRLRRDLYEKVNALGASDVDHFGTPSLLTRLTNDTNQVQVAVALGIRQLVRRPFLAVGSMAAALAIDLELGLIFAVCTPLVALVFWLAMSRSVPYYRMMQAKLDKVSVICREALSGVRVIRAFRREGSEAKRFVAAANDQADTAIAVGRLSAVLSPATFLVMDLGVVAILWSGALRVSVGELTQGEVVAFVNYMTQTLLSIVYVANLIVVFTRGAASGQRIREVLDTQPALADGSGFDAQELDGATCALQLEGVSFSYAQDGQPVLSDVSLSLGRGETLGIIGGTGSGKSTLVNLVCRLYDATDGTVRVFGHDVREWRLGDLRSHVALVPQKATLVSGSIRSNLSWRDPRASDGELWHALELAQAADFVRTKPSGLDETVEAGGSNFSGGQRQRLTIARALVGQPDLLLLDDSASALDFATDARLRAALRGRDPGTTTLIVSQRVSAVMGADRILVLDHGRVAGIGTHHDLLASCGLYGEICLSQLSAKEACA